MSDSDKIIEILLILFFPVSFCCLLIEIPLSAVGHLVPCEGVCLPGVSKSHPPLILLVPGYNSCHLVLLHEGWKLIQMRSVGNKGFVHSSKIWGADRRRPRSGLFFVSACRENDGGQGGAEWKRWPVKRRRKFALL